MNLLPPLCACAVCLMIGKGNQAYSDSPLESPACIDQYKQPSATIRELSGLLKDMRLKSFYNGARKHTLTFSLTTQDNIDTVLKEKIWHCYLVASAPLLPTKRTGKSSRMLIWAMIGLIFTTNPESASSWKIYRPGPEDE